MKDQIGASNKRQASASNHAAVEDARNQTSNENTRAGLGHAGQWHEIGQ